MVARVLVPDYGMGNLHSVKRCLSRIGVDAIVSADPAEVVKADKVILPGVGHFETAMDNLSRSGMKAELDEFVLVKKKPVMGICLGMQLMAKHSEEGNAEGFGWIDGRVKKFNITNKRQVYFFTYPVICFYPMAGVQSFFHCIRIKRIRYSCANNSCSVKAFVTDLKIVC